MTVRYYNLPLLLLQIVIPTLDKLFTVLINRENFFQPPTSSETPILSFSQSPGDSSSFTYYLSIFLKLLAMISYQSILGILWFDCSHPNLYIWLCIHVKKIMLSMLFLFYCHQPKNACFCDKANGA